MALVPDAVASTLSVNCDSGGDLQAKIDAAASGSTILVKGTCLGNFQILTKGLTLKGNPAATLDGNDLGPALSIDTPGKAVHLVGLTITGGTASLGGGIDKADGSLTLNRVDVTGNLATGASGTPGGGGLRSGSGNVFVSSSTIVGNRVLATDSAIFALGGGLLVSNGHLSIKGSTISDNRVTAHPTSAQFSAYGGGFYLEGGNLTLQSSRITGNRVTASAPGDMTAEAAAGYQDTVGSASISSTLVSSNVATATSTSGFTNTGYTLDLQASPTSIIGSRIIGNSATANSPGDAFASGGAITASAGNDITLSRSTVDRNTISATSTNGGALAEGGGLDTSSASSTTLTGSTISRNRLIVKTSGAAQANAYGGGGYVGDLKATNSTIAFNTVSATSPQSIYVDGGGLDAYGCCSVLDTTVAHNTVSGNAPTIFGLLGGGLYTSSGLTIKNTILADNTAPTGPDCSGGPTSKGHNLIRRTAGCSFTSQGTDKVGKDPMLGPLKNNGGPTQTMALAPASPALNAIPKSACAVATDQRGVHRPQGTRCDIGAYERKVV
jgi:hypothetical protein